MENNLHKLQGPILILAGPGTGKTYQLAKRIRYLTIEKEIPKDNITVITFTRPAAISMRNKISDNSNDELYTPVEKQPKTIKTMHGLGNSIINDKFPDKYSKVVHDNITISTLIEDASQLAGYSRSDGNETKACRQFGDCNESEDKKCKICKCYIDILQNCSAIDHDEQILLACKILKQDSNLHEKYKSYCKNLIVDEYQDINTGQFNLICLLSEEQNDGLFVIGDDDQSIYSWRGGSPKFIRQFKHHFGENAKIETMKKSWRCNKHILESAISIVKEFDNGRLDEKNIIEYEYVKTEGQKVHVYNTASDNKEAEKVKKIIQSTPPEKEVLVLVRNKIIANNLIKKLEKSRINFSSTTTPKQGIGLSIINSITQWILNKDDNLAFRVCLNELCKSKGLGIPSSRVRKPEKKLQREEDFLKISNLWLPVLNSDKSLWESLQDNRSNSKLYSNILEIINELVSLYESNDVSGFFKKINSFLQIWGKSNDFSYEIESIIQAANKITQTEETNNVRIMTIATSKGLEADIVCIIGLENSILPKDLSHNNIEEESRIMFVAMTRAKDELHLFHARKRSSNIMYANVYKGSGKPNIQKSQFLDTIPEEHKKVIYLK